MLSPSQFTAMGLGWFYQRSMPFIIDYYMNYIPFFNFKKWIEMELIYHALQLNKHIALKSNYNLNFKVKILYLKQLGIDVGFGYKKYDFSDSANNLIRNIGTFYGTMGMSYNF